MDEINVDGDTINLIANILSLTGRVVQEIAGNEISNSINGQELNRQTIYQLATVELRANMIKMGVQ